MGLVVSPKPYVLPASATFGDITANVIRTPVQQIAAAYVGLDMAAYNYFACLLTANLTFYFANPVDGASAVLWVRQDATGGRTVTINNTGGVNNYKDANLADLNPNPAANSITRYAFLFTTIGGHFVREVTRTFLAVQ